MLTIKQISKEDWKLLSEDAHQVVFREKWKSSLDRIDYALLGVNEEDVPVFYVTVREMDAETAYMQYGGAFPSVRGSYKSLPLYLELMKWFQGRYKRVATLIENTNLVMLKFAMKAGFLITGMRNFNGHILLEHLNEF